jgi:hypothetical protein
MKRMTLMTRTRVGTIWTDPGAAHPSVRKSTGTIVTWSNQSTFSRLLGDERIDSHDSVARRVWTAIEGTFGLRLGRVSKG